MTEQAPGLMWTRLGRNCLRRGPLCRGFHQHVLLSLVAAKKGVVAGASAKRLHSNVLLSACVKENVPQTDQRRTTISHVACISTEQVMQKCVVYPIGLLVFAISLLCNYFKVADVLQKRYCQHSIVIFWCSILKKYHPKSAIKDNHYSTA